MAAVHIRQIEEIATVLEFLIKAPQLPSFANKSDIYNDFKWRWDNFKIIHSIRNRIFNLKTPLHPTKQQWIDNNLSSLQKVDKFSGDSVKDENSWKNFSNWLAEYGLTKIFKELGQEQKYYFQSYDWGSQHVHFSPIPEMLSQMAFTDDRRFKDLIEEVAVMSLLGTLRHFSTIVTHPENTRNLFLKLLLFDMYCTFRDEPERATGLASQPRYSRVLSALCEKDYDLERLKLAVLGVADENRALIQAKA